MVSERKFIDQIHDNIYICYFILFFEGDGGGGSG